LKNSPTRQIIRAEAKSASGGKCGNHSPPRLNIKKGLTGQAERNGKARKKIKLTTLSCFPPQVE
jgi:hypothetical protein